MDFFLSYFCSFIAKTETANIEMDYIIKTKLSGKGSAMQRNTYPSNYPSNFSSLVHSGGGKILPLFSMLTKPQDTINKLMTKYGSDMMLFGYNYKLDGDEVLALCDNFKQFNMCC